MDTIETLIKCVVEGNVIKLPNIELDRPVYLEVKKKLELIGGKWKGGRINGFVFEEDPTELLAMIQSGEEINLQKQYQFFSTPAPLANYLVAKAAELVDFKPGLMILEPSAGDGAIVKAVVKHFPKQRVDCIELKDLNRVKLQKVYGADIVGMDFLNDYAQCLDQYDLVLANPPFSNNQDIEHIRKMYECLKPNGAIITIASTSWINGSQKKQQDFRNWLSDIGADIEQVPAGQFKESGTNVPTTIITIKKEVTTEDLKDATNLLVQKTEALTEAKADYLQSKTQEKSEKEPEENQTVFQSPEEILDEIGDSMKAAEGHFNKLKQLLNNKNEEEMNFFKQLSETMGESELTFVVKQKKDIITLMVLVGGLTTASNLTFSGTAEDFDSETDGFLAQLKKPLTRVAGLVSNVDEFEKELDSKATTAAKKPAAKKSSAKDKSADSAELQAEEKPDPAQVDLEKAIEAEKSAAPSETEEERKAREEREQKLIDLDKAAKESEEAGDFVKAIESMEEAKALSDYPALYQEKIDALFKKIEEGRVEALNNHLKKADEEEAAENFREAAKSVKAAKDFHKTPDELDVRIKALLQKAMEKEFENI